MHMHKKDRIRLHKDFDPSVLRDGQVQSAMLGTWIGSMAGGNKRSTHYQSAPV